MVQVMINIFNHIFYRVHCWNIKVIKEKDFPVLSAYLTISALLGINILSIIFMFLVYVIKNPQLYPTWGNWIIVVFSLVPNYYIFINKKKYKKILDESENLDKTEKRKKDIISIIYVLLTFLIGIYIINASREFLTHQGMLIN